MLLLWSFEIWIFEFRLHIYNWQCCVMFLWPSMLPQPHSHLTDILLLRTFSCDEMQPEWLQGWIFHIWLVDVIMNDGIRKITFSMDKDKLVHDIPGIFMKKRRLSIRIFYWLCLLKKALVLDDKSRGGVWVLMKFRQKWKVLHSFLKEENSNYWNNINNKL